MGPALSRQTPRSEINLTIADQPPRMQTGLRGVTGCNTSNLVHLDHVKVSESTHVELERFVLRTRASPLSINS
jgi:hypothetical protein